MLQVSHLSLFISIKIFIVVDNNYGREILLTQRKLSLFFSLVLPFLFIGLVAQNLAGIHVETATLVQGELLPWQ